MMKTQINFLLELGNLKLLLLLPFQNLVFLPESIGNCKKKKKKKKKYI